MNLDVHLHAHGERRYMGKLAEQGGTMLFQYAPEFLDSGINISPFKLPLSPEVKEDPKRTFDGLFGVFNDSLPDGWGLLLLDRALRSSDNRKLTIRDHRILTTLRRVCCSGRSEGDRPASANW